MKPGLLVAGLLVAFIGTPAAKRAEPREYVLDQDRSRIWVVTHRSGLSFLGHKHAIVPTTWSARFCLADPVHAGATASLVVATKSLVIVWEIPQAAAPPPVGGATAHGPRTPETPPGVTSCSAARSTSSRCRPGCTT